MDGMASAALQDRGWQATALDLSSKDFDPRARTSGVRLLEMNAGGLQIPDDSFDLSFSYNAFEHIAEVEAAFAELIRVTKPEGVIFLDFGPLYNSPAGLHAYRSVRVPYCQFLFDRATLDAFCREIDRPPIRYEQVNGRPLKDYWALWSRHLTSEAVEPVAYEERWNGQGIPLIERYASCFSSKGLTFEERIVQSIRACFRVRKGRTAPNPL